MTRTRSASRLLGLLVLSLAFVAPAAADLFGDLHRSAVDTARGLFGGNRDAAKVLDRIPDRVSGANVTFAVNSEKVTPMVPAAGAEVAFNPYHDAADFTNFASASVCDGRVVRERDVNGGTCFGISYFVSMYYSRLIRPVQQGKTAKLFSIYGHEFSMWDALTKDLSKVGRSENDGVNYVVKAVIDADAERNGRPFYNSENMKEDLDAYRLRSFSQGAFSEKVKVAAIAHHRDQREIDREKIKTAKASKLAAAMAEIKSRLEKHGTQLFYFQHYKPENWIGWRSWDWGHACAIYRISTVRVEGSNGGIREAWKLHFYDPNFTYGNRDKVESGEGFGTYLLYFPDAGQITFSKRVQDVYGVQTEGSTIDDDETRLGYYDVYDGHPVQQQIAKKAIIEASVGQGCELTGDELEKAREKGKIKMSESFTEID